MKRVHFFWHPLFGLAGIAGFSAVVMLLWNWLAPAIFGLTAITFWQALGLLALTRILFGKAGRFWLRDGMERHHHRCNPIREKWQKMTPEERKEFVHKRHRPFDRGFDYDFFDHDFVNEQEPEKQN